MVANPKQVFMENQTIVLTRIDFRSRVKDLTVMQITNYDGKKTYSSGW
jgi:hypothetical protein